MSSKKQDSRAEEKALLDNLKAAQISSMQGVWGSEEDAVWDAL
jgi:hypothetical protein